MRQSLRSLLSFEFAPNVSRRRQGSGRPTPPLAHQLGSLWTLLPTVHRRLGAPLCSKATDPEVRFLVKPQEVAENEPVQ